MIGTLQNITTDIINSYSESLTENERINNMLDQINDQKQKFKSLSDRLKHLDSLISKITWIDDLNGADEVLIKGIIAMGKEADIQFRKYYAAKRREYAAKAWFKEEFRELKETIELHHESVLEVEHIIFNLRKDKEFKALSKLVDEL